MKSVLLGLSIGLAFCCVSWAGLKAPPFTAKTKVEGREFKLIAVPPSAHHFNTQAPMSLTLESDSSKIKPSHALKSEITFDLPSATKDSGNLSLFLCDDANTFCEKHELSVSWKGAPGALSLLPKKPTPPEPAAPKSVSGEKTVDSHGFIDNDAEKAFNLAREKKLPLLIDFYGIWCPPCNELNDKVFVSREFQSQTAKFVRLKLDADARINEHWYAKYKIGGLPTVIFASSDGDEIARVIGFRSKAEFLAEARKAYGSRHEPFSGLKTKADAGDRSASDRLGLIYMNRGEYALAIRALEKTSSQREALLASRSKLAEEQAKNGDSEMKGAWARALETLLREFPESPDALQYRESLANLLDEAKQTEKAKAQRQALISTAKKLIAKPSLLKGYDYSVGDLWMSMADAQEALGKKEDAAGSWKAAAAEHQRKYDSGAQRGASLELAYCLRKLGQTEKASKIYENMQGRFPREFTFYLADAKMNLQLKRYEKARDLALKALANSYDVNHLDSAKVLATIYKEMKQPAQAKKVIHEALDSLPPIPPSSPDADLSQSRLRKHAAALVDLDRTL